MCSTVNSKSLLCVAVLDTHPLLSTFQLMLLEHIIMCRLIMGHKSVAIQEVSMELGILFTPFQKFSHGICPVSK